MKRRYNTTKDVNGKGGERAVENSIAGAVLYTPAVAEAILPSRNASTATKRIGEPEVIFTAEQMGEFQVDLDDMNGPSELDLREIEGECP